MIIENKCYIANVGDSRCLISLNKGKDIRVLTTDHKPNEEHESLRIIANGGKIYQTKTPTKVSYMLPTQILLGPYRVLPGRLSVSRTIGDAEAKLPEFGGMENVVIAKPEITYFCIDEEIDFLVMGCDGIFDQLSNEEVSECVWSTCENDKMKKEDIDEYDVTNVHEQCLVGVDMIMKSSLMRKTLDNITVVLVAFKNFEEEINQRLGTVREDFQYGNLPINITESYLDEHLATEPSYNYQHEKIKLKSGLKQNENNDTSIKSKGKERELSPPSSTQNILCKKSNKKVGKIPLSPKMRGVPKMSYFKKK